MINSPTKAEHQLPRLDNQIKGKGLTPQAGIVVLPEGRTGDRGQGPGKAPASRRAGARPPALAGRRCPGRLWELGRLPDRLLPVTPPRVGWLTPCPDRQEKKTLLCDEATGRLEWKWSSTSSAICCYKQGAPCPLCGVPQRQGHHPSASSSSTPTGSTRWGLGHTLSTLVTQRRVQAPPHPAPLSPLSPALASPEHRKEFFSIHRCRIIF